MTTQKIILLGVSVGMILALGCSAFWYVSRQEASPAFAADELASVDFWEGRIRAQGAPTAYKELARESARHAYGQQHRFAHAFGEALYNKGGVAGIATCDAQFSFGCYHAFLGAAIADKGLSSVEDLNEACFEVLPETSLSCQHGIGHGILTDIGYDFPDIKKALEMCASLPHADPIGGCYGGVFMEYDSRTMWGDAAVHRDGDKSKPFALCDQLGDAYGRACSFWTPQWWAQAFFAGQTDVEQTMSTMGSWCEDTAFGKRFIKDCFEGIGNTVTFKSDFDPIRARALCEATSRVPDHQLWCLRIAANHFGIDVSPEAGLEVCAALSGGAHDMCVAYATNHANIAQPL